MSGVSGLQCPSGLYRTSVVLTPSVFSLPALNWNRPLGRCWMPFFEINDMPHFQYSSLFRSVGLSFLTAAVLAACGGGSGSTNADSVSASTSDASATDAASASTELPTADALAKGGSSSSWTLCAQENGTCNFSGTRNVKYGTTTAYVTRALTGPAACDNATFGDPAVGQWKSCWYGSTTTSTTTTTPTTTTSTWTECAQENGTCTFSGTHNVRYGTATSYVTKTFTSSAACNNTAFGDPAVGQWKTCSVDSTTVATTTTTTTTTTPTTSTPTTTTTTNLPAGVTYTGVTAAMWTEIDAQRVAFGDPNNCHAKVDALPTSGGVTVSPGADINAALASNSLVFLNGGTYKLSSTISLDAGKKLIGVAGQTVTIDASAVEQAVYLRDNAVLANVNIRNAIDVGVNFYNASTDSGSSNSLIYRVSVGATGLGSTLNPNGVGFGVWYGAANNCLVSTEAFDTWNESGPTSTLASGGNADGYRNSYSAHHNTFIDSHSFRNGDDGFDMWEGGIVFMYFNTSHDNGKTSGQTVTGDGNGVKLGIGSVSHKLYKVSAFNNKANGFDINGNTVQPTLVQTSATGNGGSAYFGIVQ